MHVNCYYISWNCSLAPHQVLRRGARRTLDRSHDRAGRDGRPARPERRRQVDDDRHDARADPARFGHRLAVRDVARRGGRGRRRRRDAPDRLAYRAPACPRARHDGRVALPAPARGRRRARAQRDRGPSPTAGRPSCPEVRPSGSASRSRWSPTRTCCCSTSRPRRSTSRRGATSGPRCEASRRAARRSSSPPTISRRPTPSPTGSSCSAAGPSSPTARRPRSRPGSAARTIRATLPGAELDALRTLAGVISVERHGDAVILSCSRRRGRASRVARPLPVGARHRSARRRARGGVLGAHRRARRRQPRTTGGRTDAPHLPPLRAAAELPQLAVRVLLARVPAHPVLRGREPARHATSTASPSRSTSWPAWPRWAR